MLISEIQAILDFVALGLRPGYDVDAVFGARTHTKIVQMRTNDGSNSDARTKIPTHTNQPRRTNDASKYDGKRKENRES